MVTHLPCFWIRKNVHLMLLSNPQQGAEDEI